MESASSRTSRCARRAFASFLLVGSSSSASTLKRRCVSTQATESGSPTPHTTRRCLRKTISCFCFYKGKWCKEGQDQHFDPTTDIKFEIQDADSEIVLLGQPLVVSRLGTEMDRRCETKPNSKICYHSMTEAPRADQPSYFTATTTSTVFWSAQSQMIKNEKIANPNHAAGLVPLQTWDSNATKIVFLSKWSHRGLMPVRPYVFVRENIILAPGTCVQLVPK